MHYGARVIGVIVVSKLGLDQFDEDDLRLLEVLAGHAAVAVENARLYEVQRREAESAKALLEFGRDLAAAEGLEQVLERIVEGAAAADRRAPRLALAPGVDRRRRSSGRRAAATSSAHRIVGLRFAAESDRAVLDRTGRTRSPPSNTRRSATRPPAARARTSIAPFTVEGRWGAIAVAVAGRRRVRRPRARAARRSRAPGEARDRERLQLRGPRAHVPLDRRGARERARGAGRIHLVACALDHRHGAARRRASSGSTATR